MGRDRRRHSPVNRRLAVRYPDPKELEDRQLYDHYETTKDSKSLKAYNLALFYEIDQREYLSGRNAHTAMLDQWDNDRKDGSNAN